MYRLGTCHISAGITFLERVVLQEAKSLEPADSCSTPCIWLELRCRASCLMHVGGCSKMEKHEDGMKERRWVKLSGGDYNANQLPPEWDQWLRKSRLQAPTAEDMAKCVLASLVSFDMHVL